MSSSARRRSLSEQEFQRALENCCDAACAELLAKAAASSSTGGGVPRLSTTFEELAARGLGQAAVKLAQLESGETDLKEAEADSREPYLHAAAAVGAPGGVVAALVAAGCPLNAMSKAGDTPLHVAAAGGHLGTVTALLEAGADALQRNSRTGRTPRAQGGVGSDIKAALLDAEEVCRQRRAAQQSALWDAKMRATQTESACRLGCL